MYAKNTRVSQLDLRPSIAEQVGDKDGNLNVESTLRILSESLKENKLLRVLMISLAGGCSLLIVANIAISVSVAFLTRQFTVDPTTGLASVNVNTDNPYGNIMKTSVASFNQLNVNIHNMTPPQLRNLNTVDFFAGNVSFFVKGFAKRRNETVLLVEGGRIIYGANGIYDVIGDDVMNLLFGDDEDKDDVEANATSLVVDVEEVDQFRDRDHDNITDDDIITNDEDINNQDRRELDTKETRRSRYPNPRSKIRGSSKPGSEFQRRLRELHTNHIWAHNNNNQHCQDKQSRRDHDQHVTDSQHGRNGCFFGVYEDDHWKTASTTRHPDMWVCDLDEISC